MDASSAKTDSATESPRTEICSCRRRWFGGGGGRPATVPCRAVAAVRPARRRRPEWKPERDSIEWGLVDRAPTTLDIDHAAGRRRHTVFVPKSPHCHSELHLDRGLESFLNSLQMKTSMSGSTKRVDCRLLQVHVDCAFHFQSISLWVHSHSEHR